MILSGCNFIEERKQSLYLPSHQKIQKQVCPRDVSASWPQLSWSQNGDCRKGQGQSDKKSQRMQSSILTVLDLLNLHYLLKCTSLDEQKSALQDKVSS